MFDIDLDLDLDLDCITCFSLFVMLVILVNCVFMAIKDEIPKTELVSVTLFTEE